MLTICPKCLNKIKGGYIKQNNKLYLVKKCNEHGIFKILISNDIRYYKNLEKHYLNSKFNKKTKYIHLNIYDKNYLSKLSKIIRKKKQKIYLTAQEARYKKDILNKKDPINHKNILNIISLIKKSGNFPIVFSKEGLSNKIIKNLKENGLKEIHLEVIDYKLKEKTIEYLEKKKINISLEVYIEKIDKKKIDGILNYAKKKKIIKAVFFKIISNLILDELIDSFSEIEKIEKKKFLRIQRLFYLTGKKRCFYNQYYPIFRKDFSFFIVGFLKVCNIDNFDFRYINCAGKEIGNDNFISLAEGYISQIKK